VSSSGEYGLAGAPANLSRIAALARLMAASLLISQIPIFQTVAARRLTWR
jgi:hypothetical protein